MSAPVLLLLADQKVELDDNGKVVKWGNLVAGSPDASYLGAQQTDPQKRPKLVTEADSMGSNRKWIQFDGAKTFLTTYFGDLNTAKVPCRTVFVLMNVSGETVPSLPEENWTDYVVPGGFGSTEAEKEETAAALRYAFNPSMTIIGDQTYT